MTPRFPHRPTTHHRPGGFTLVELLVALGLVSLLLLMFAQVFQIATGTMSTQRGLMENDQRARAITTILDNDLTNRSMRTVMPFTPDEADPAVGGFYSFSQRLGYLYISENEPYNDSDDVLQFTALISAQLSGDAAASDSESYYGKALNLGSIGGNPNQPDADDASIVVNNTAASTMAEIVYFVRNGNLYRRVLLIRNPLNDSYNPQPMDGSTGSGSFFFDPASGYYTSGSFWNDFDFSARYDTVLGYPQLPGSLTTSAIDNSGSAVTNAIALPYNRFGHNHDFLDGKPREYVNSNNDFIGRYTQEETSHSAFIYPRAIPGVGNPMSQSTALTLNASGVVSNFSAGPRRGEDLLLSNVHAFDIKVWDDALGMYVDVGASNAVDYSKSGSLNPNYGPKGSAAPAENRVYDTWHRMIDLNGDMVRDDAPIVPKYTSQWISGTQYKVGDVVVPTPPNVTNANCAYQVTGIAQIDDLGSGNFSVTPINSGTSFSAEPSWPTVVGTSVAEGNYTVSATRDTRITWTAIPIAKRMKSIRITIRYLDISSDQMRQVTLNHSLMN